MQTYVVYTLTLLAVLFFAYQAQRTNKRIYVYAIVFLLTFVSGFRDFSVGKDTESYIQIFQYLEKGMFDWAYGEIGFKYISYILLRATGNYSFLFIIYACVTNYFIVFRLWDFQKIASFTWMIACYYISFYFMSMNIMRQFVAIAIVFYATRYIEQKKYIYFFCWMGIATLLHTSSLIGIGFVGLDIFQWRYLNRKQKCFIILSILFSPLAIPYILKAVARYGKYLEMIVSVNVGFMILFKFVIFTFSLITFYKGKANGALLQDSYEYTTRTVKLYYLLGLIITGLGYFFLYTERSGLPFYIFECVYFGMLVKNTECNQIFKFVLTLLLLYLFVLVLISNGQGQIPYTFIWQT